VTVKTQAVATMKRKVQLSNIQPNIQHQIQPTMNARKIGFLLHYRYQHGQHQIESH